MRPKRRGKTGGWLAWAGVLGLALLGACKADESLPNVGAIADASYGEAPTRGVTNDLPDGLNLFGDGPDTSLSGNVGSTPVVSTDAQADKPSNRPPDGGGPPDAGGGNACNLVLQDCTGGRACYPATGGSTCRPAGVLAEDFPCDQHDDCVRGLVCVEVFTGTGKLCEPVCDTTAIRPCPDNRTCRPLGGGLFGSCQP